MNAVFLVLGQLVLWIGAIAGILFAYSHRDKLSDKLAEKPDVDKSPFQYLGKKETYTLRSASSPRKIKEGYTNPAPFEYNVKY